MSPIGWLRALWFNVTGVLSPARRRARRKRELEAVLRSAGLSRSQAMRASATYFDRGRKAVEDGQ